MSSIAEAQVAAVLKLCDQYRANCDPTSLQAQVGELFRRAVTSVSDEPTGSIICADYPNCDRPHAGGVGGIPVHPPAGSRISGADGPLIPDEPSAPRVVQAVAKALLEIFGSKSGAADPSLGHILRARQILSAAGMQPEYRIEYPWSAPGEDVQRWQAEFHASARHRVEQRYSSPWEPFNPEEKP